MSTYKKVKLKNGMGEYVYPVIDPNDAGGGNDSLYGTVIMSEEGWQFVLTVDDQTYTNGDAVSYIANYLDDGGHLQSIRVATTAFGDVVCASTTGFSNFNDGTGPESDFVICFSIPVGVDDTANTGVITIDSLMVIQFTFRTDNKVGFGMSGCQLTPVPAEMLGF